MLLCSACSACFIHSTHTPPHPYTHTHSLCGPFPLQGGWQSFGDLFEREHSLIQELRNWVCWISLWRNSCSVYYRYMYACTAGLLSLLWYTLTLLVFVEWMVHVLTAFSPRRNVNNDYDNGSVYVCSPWIPKLELPLHGKKQGEIGQNSRPSQYLCVLFMCRRTPVCTTICRAAGDTSCV